MTTRDQKAGVRAFFDRSEKWKGRYYRDAENPFGQMLVRRRRYILGMLREHIGDGAVTICDVGCGPGEYLGELGGNGIRVVGMDVAEGMIRASDEMLRGKGWSDPPGLVCGDIEHSPFRSESFDAVLCVGVLGYLEHDERALRELGRLLRPGGSLLVSVRNLNALMTLPYIARLKARQTLRHGLGHVRSTASIVTHAHPRWKSRAYDIGRLEKMIASHGFRRMEGLTFGYDLRALARLGLGAATIVRIETRLESLMMAMPLRALRRSGWGYIGLFRKESGDRGP
jgi:SAM-dependent methyltransferase